MAKDCYIPREFGGYLSQLMCEGMLGMYEIRVGQGELRICGRPAIESLFGLASDVLVFDLDSYAATHCHPDDRQSVRELRHRLFDDAGHYAISYRVRNCRTGEWRRVYAFGAGSTAGDDVLLYGGLIDVTAQVARLQP